MKQRTLSEQIYAGRLACNNYVDVSNWQGNGDGFACLTIDCYPLAQLNTNLHLYDKQLNLIQALVFCCLSIFPHLRVLHYLSSLHPWVFTHFSCSLPVHVATASLFALNSGQMEIGNHMHNMPSNWHPVALPDTSAVCFLVFYSY